MATSIQINKEYQFKQFSVSLNNFISVTAKILTLTKSADNHSKVKVEIQGVGVRNMDLKVFKSKIIKS